MGKYDEKRAAQRVMLQLHVDYACKDNFVFEYTANLSQSGIFIQTEKPFNPGTQLELQFSPKENPETVICVKGEVLWINENDAADGSKKAGMGIKFVNVSEATRLKITSLVKRLAVL